MPNGRRVDVLCRLDMVISGGVNIYPAEIEQALVQCPGVSDSADEIAAFLRPRLANYKIPRRITFQASLPREESGKRAGRYRAGRYEDIQTPAARSVLGGDRAPDLRPLASS
jgi:acyl-CoA synthetase (AMP-forming)/AMP-acid ligase II